MFKRGEAPATARSPEASRKTLLCSGEDGQLEALMVLRVEGWPLCVTTVWQRDENAFKYAALGGQIEMLLWMHANGCPWSEWGRLRKRRKMETPRCFSGRTRTAVRGTRIRARTWRRADTSRCFSGRARTAASGMRTRSAVWQGCLIDVRKSKYWSGCGFPKY